MCYRANKRPSSWNAKRSTHVVHGVEISNYDLCKERNGFEKSVGWDVAERHSHKMQTLESITPSDVILKEQGSSGTSRCAGK